MLEKFRANVLKGRRGGGEETLREFINVGHSSGSRSNAMREEEVKAVSTAM